MPSGRVRVWLTALAVLLLALGGGWLWGSTGRWAAQSRASGAELRQWLVEARADVLDARIEVYEVNFGNASRRLEASKVPLQQAMDRLQSEGEDEVLALARSALAKIEEARSLASSLDQTANTRAAEASALLSDTLKRLP